MNEVQGDQGINRTRAMYSALLNSGAISPGSVPSHLLPQVSTNPWHGWWTTTTSTPSIPPSCYGILYKPITCQYATTCCVFHQPAEQSFHRANITRCSWTILWVSSFNPVRCFLGQPSFVSCSTFTNLSQ